MNYAETEIRRRISIRTILGPLCILLSIGLLAFKESTLYWELTLVSFTGFIFSWKWGKQGLAASLGILLSVLFYDGLYRDGPMPIWELGLSLSLAMAFFITSLAKSEIEEAFEGSNVSNELKFLKEQNSSLQKIIKEYEQKILERNQAIDIAKQLSEAAKNELLAACQQKESNDRELMDSRLKIAKLEEQIEEHFSTSSLKIEEWQKEAQLKDKEIEELKNRTRVEDEVLKQAFFKEMREQIENLSREKSLLESTVSHLQHNLEESRAESVQKSELLEDCDVKIHDLTGKLQKLVDKLKELEEEKEKLVKGIGSALEPEELNQKEESRSKEFSRLKGMHEQLREQFHEKSGLLDETRRELFHAQEEKLYLEKKYQEEKLAGEQELFSKLEYAIHSLSKTSQTQEDEIDALQEMISRLINSR